MKKICSIIICICLVLSLCACDKKRVQEDLTFSTKDKDIVSQLSIKDDTAQISLSKTSRDEIIEMIDNINVEYPYSELFQLDECYSRMQTKISVDAHQYNALDESGSLTAENLVETVNKNNEDYLEQDKNNKIGYDELDDEYLLQVCKVIVDTVEYTLQKYPDIDKERVYCNLGNLKVFYKTAMVDNAQVTSDMFLHISENMFEVVSLMSGENACRNVLVHEVMHMIQMGCSCENIENCNRRCGISYYWDDFELNTADFKWFFEGSAERSMCNITGDKWVTYEYMMNYLCSLNFATMFQDDVPANYAETISFYDDTNKLFELFGCKTQDEKYEVIKMMIAINIIQMAPEEFLEVYSKEYGIDTSDQKAIDEINLTIKPSVCLTLSKYFYKNLANTLAQNDDITINDVCYIINLFEATMNNHLSYTKKERTSYNAEFVDTYTKIRSKFFELASTDSSVNLKETYGGYSILDKSAEAKIVNASLKWNDEEKTKFLLERTDYLEFDIEAKVGY